MFSIVPGGRFRRLSTIAGERVRATVDFWPPVKSSGRVLCHFRSAGEKVELQLGMGGSGWLVFVLAIAYEDGASEKPVRLRRWKRWL